MHYFNLKFRARPSAYVSRARKGTDDIVREKCNNIAFFAISVSKNQLCQTGIIRIRFSAADFRLNRVIRLANTVKY